MRAVDERFWTAVYISKYHKTLKKRIKKLPCTRTHAAHPCLHMNDLSRLLTNLSTHTLRDFSPHREAPRIKGPASSSVQNTQPRGVHCAAHPLRILSSSPNKHSCQQLEETHASQKPRREPTAWSYRIDRSEMSR